MCFLKLLPVLGMGALLLLFGGCDCADDAGDDDDDTSPADDDQTDDDSEDDDDATDDDDDDTGAALGALTSVSPNSFENFLPVKLTIIGQHFPGQPQSIRLGETELLDVRLASYTKLTAVAPSGIAPGVYDLIVTYPDDETRLSDAVTVLDALTPFVHLTGTVSDPDEQPVAELSVYTTRAPDGDLTDSGGRFSIYTPPGLDSLLAYNPPYSGADGIPWGEGVLAADTEFLQDEDFALTLDFVWLSGVVTGPDKAALQEVEIQVSPTTEYGLGAEALTDFFGAWTVPLYRGVYGILADPATETELAPAYEPAFALTADDACDFTLEPGLLLTGLIADRDGSPLPDLTIVPHLHTDKSVAMGWTTTDADGMYRTYLPTGAFYVNVTDPEGNQPQLPQFSTFAFEMIDLAGNTVLDYQFAYADIDLSISFDGAPFAGDLWADFYHPEETNWNASFAFPAELPTFFLGNYTVILKPTSGFGAAPTRLTDVLIAGDGALDLVLDPAVRLSGLLADQTGAPLPGFEICASLSSGEIDPPLSQCSGTAEDGSYLLDLAPGTYRIEVRRDAEPDAWAGGDYYVAENIGITSDFELPLSINIATVTGQLRRGGAAVTGWRVSLSSPALLSAATLVDADGCFTLMMPPEMYDFVFQPLDLTTARPTAVFDQQINASAEVLVNLPVD